jgi:hypothetical protein
LSAAVVVDSIHAYVAGIGVAERAVGRRSSGQGAFDLQAWM